MRSWQATTRWIGPGSTSRLDLGGGARAFEEALLEEDSPEALEGLGAAASWLEDAQVAIDARERAYRLFRERPDAEGAARTAAGVANDLLTFRGDPAMLPDGYSGLAAGSKTGPARP